MTKEQIENRNLVRVGFGLDPLPLEGENQEDVQVEEKEEVVVEQNVEGQDDLKQEEKQQEVLSQQDKQQETPSINEDAVREFLKSQGIEVANIDDLKTKLNREPSKEELEAKAAQRENEMLSVALGKGWISKKEYDDFAFDKKNIEALVYDDFAKEELAENPELTDEELHSKFSEEYGIGYDKTSNTYKRGQRKLSLLADKLMQEKHSKALELSNKYGAYESEFNSVNEFNKKVLSAAPKYKEDIENIFAGAGKVSVKVGDKDDAPSYDFEYPVEAVNELKNTFLTEERLREYVKAGWDKNEIKDIVDTVLYRKYQNKLISKVAKDYASSELLRNQMGDKGIIATDNGDVKNKSNAKEYSPEHLEVRKQLGVHKEN